jgi:hypothetical protein
VEKLAEAGDFFHVEVLAMWGLEEGALRTNHKCELVAPVGLDFTYLSN